MCQFKDKASTLKLSNFIYFMTFIKQKNNIPVIVRVETEKKKYLQQSQQLIERLKEELLLRSIVPVHVKNSLEFSYWGFNFLVQPEIKMNENNNSGYGELIAYIVNSNTAEYETILSYTFDNSGKVNSRYDIRDFPKFYYYELLVRVIELSMLKRAK